MSGSKLTRDEATTRAALLEVDAYDISLDLTDGNGGSGAGTFRSLTTVTFHCRQPGETSFIDLIAASVASATLNGVALDTSTHEQNRRVTLPNLAERNVLEVDAQCLFMNTGEGLHRFVDPVDNEVYLFSQSETRDAHRIYANFDQPDLKATFTYHVTAPVQWTVVSNSPVDRTEPGPHGSIIWHFAATPRIPTYITAVVAGNYHGVQDEHHGMPLGLYCRQSLAPYLEADDILTVTKQGLDFYQQKFDRPYAFAKYDQLFVPEFNAGAMENAGCVTFSEELLFRSRSTQLRYETRANVVLHEMAHMWFGDLVTMKWWDDLWLNESFAEWAASWSCVGATKYNEAWTSFCTGRKAWGYRQDQLSSTHPIAVDAPDVAAAEANFDGITYAKGASVLKQLVAYVGEETFLSALRPYFREHAFSNATLADLMTSLENVSGRNMSDWSRLWLQTAGVNTLRPEYTVDSEGRFTRFGVRQEAAADYPTLRPHRIAIGLYDHDATGALVRRERLEVDIADVFTPVEALVGAKRPALVLLNDDDLTYAKIRLDAHSMSNVVRDIGSIDSSLARGLLWAAAWDMTRDGELATRDYLHLTVNGLPTETVLGVVQTQLAYVLRALELYADPAWTVTGLTELADRAWQTAQAAAAGSDLQLVWVRAFASAARRADQLQTVHALLNGESTLDGLAVDTELRWHLVKSLVAAGVIGDAEIDAELELDPTDRGQRHAATCRALAPSLEAKAAAWRDITEETELPNQTVLAILRGFGAPEHAELLAQYTAPYFAAASKAWHERTTKVAENIAELLYPAWAIDAETVRLTDEYLTANPDLPGPLRRLMAEGRDSVIRAINARACDAAAATINTPQG